MIWVYNCIPLVLALLSFWHFLKEIGIIVYTDQQRQKDYEDYMKKKSSSAAILSFISFLIFLIMFIRNVI